MNWKREVQDKLYKYPYKKQAISNLKERILYLDETLKTIKPVVMDKVPLRGGGTKQEDVMLNRIMEKELLTANLKDCKVEVKDIEKSLKILTETELEVIELFYLSMYRTSIEKICDRLGYEKSQVYNIRNDALRKMAIFLYGREFTE